MDSSQAKLAHRLLNYVETGDLNGIYELLFKKSTNSQVLVGVINCKGSETGQNPLHLSASRLHHEAVQLLLEHGADPNVADEEGRTAVVLVILRLKECPCEKCTRNAIRCINQLSDHRADLSIRNNFGESPLYLCAQYRLLDCATALLRNGVPLERQIRKPRFIGRNQSMLSFLSERLPSIVLDVFDRAVTIVGSRSIHDPDCEVCLDFSVILPSKVMESYQTGSTNKSNINNVNILDTNLEDKTQGVEFNINLRNDPEAKANGEGYKCQKEMGFLNDLVESQGSSDPNSKLHRAILRHPVVSVFTDVKWKSLELIFIGFILLQICVLLAFTTFIFITIFADCPQYVFKNIRTLSQYREILRSENQVELKSTGRIPLPKNLCQLRLASKVISGSVFLCIALVLVKEVLHLIMDFKEYVKDVLNYVQLFGLGSMALTILIAWDPSASTYAWLNPVASFGVAISWCQLFVQIGRFPQLAIYVDMFAKIAINFCWSLAMYIFILIGFAMSYCVLFPSKPEIIDIPLAFIRVLTMMSGELDYDNLFKMNSPDLEITPTIANANSSSSSVENLETEHQRDGNGEKRFAMEHAFAGHLWYVACVIMLTFVLTNLLVGLAVSDIQGCKKDAEIVVMKRRIRYTWYLEKSYFLLTHFMPKLLKDYLRNKITIIKPNGEETVFCFQFTKLPVENCKMIIRPNDPHDRFLSQESKNAIKNWLQGRHNPRTKQFCRFDRSQQSKTTIPLEANEESFNLKNDQVKHKVKEGFINHNDDNGTRDDRVGSFLGSPPPVPTLSTTDDAFKDICMERMERRVKELDHKLEILIESMQSRSKAPHW